jgi:hypothetical protein
VATEREAEIQAVKARYRRAFAAAVDKANEPGEYTRLVDQAKAEAADAMTAINAKYPQEGR